MRQFFTFGHGASPGCSWNDEMWSYPEVMPLVHPLVNYPAVNSLAFNPPGTGSTYPTPANSLAGVATQVANWASYFRDQLRLLGRELPPWAMYLHNHGYVTDGLTSAVFGHPDDLISGLASPYAINGESAVKAFSETVFPLIAAELTARGLPAPSYYFDDLESYPDLGGALPTSTGYWNEFLDEYADLVFVDDVRVTDYFYGDGVTFDPNQTIWQPNNRNFYQWFSWFVNKQRDYLFDEAIYKPARAVWPNIQISNYNNYSSAADLAPPYAKPWDTPRQKYNLVTRYDYSSFPVYIDAINLRADALLPDWLSAMGLPSTGDRVADIRQYAVARHKMQMHAAMRASPTKPLLPWLPTIDYVETTNDGLSTTVGMTHADILDLAMTAYSLGSRKMHIWWGGTLSANAKERTTQLIREMRGLEDRNVGVPLRGAVFSAPKMPYVRTQEL